MQAGGTAWRRRLEAQAADAGWNLGLEAQAGGAGGRYRLGAQAADAGWNLGHRPKHANAH